MATGIHDLETLPPAHLDPDAAKFYEVVDGQIVENPPMGARESILASFLQVDGPGRPVESTGPRRDRNALLARSRPETEAAT